MGRAASLCRRASLSLVGVLLPAAVLLPSALAAPTVWSVNGHSYEFVPAPGITWAQAQAACEARDGYLLVLNSVDEHQFIRDLLEGTPGAFASFSPCQGMDGWGNGPWIGAGYGLPAARPAPGAGWVTGEEGFFYGETPCENSSATSRVHLVRQEPFPGDFYLRRLTDPDAWVPGYIVESCAEDTDTDADGLWDCWEGGAFNGIPIDPVPGTQVPRRGVYRLVGSDPLTKDLFVEVDALTGRAPPGLVLFDVYSAFGGSPVANPLGTTGIKLHFSSRPINDFGVSDVQGATPATWHKDWVAFDNFKRDWFGDPLPHERGHPDWQYIRDAKLKAFRYAVFADRFKVDSLSTDLLSGFAINASRDPGSAGREFLVSLGPLDNPTEEELAGTFMHELGHTLGLQHGGNDGVLGKPNYKSVMNYLWQMPPRVGGGCDAASTGPLTQYRDSYSLDYSPDSLPPLVEDHLDERAGITENFTYNVIYNGLYVPVGAPYNAPASALAQIVPMYGPVNWNRIGAADEPDVQADVNRVPKCGGEETVTLGQTLTGYNDWARIILPMPAQVPLRARTATAQDDAELTIAAFEALGSLQLDCNLNGLPDQADIDAGRSQDDNQDGVPDECTAGTVGVNAGPPEGRIALAVDRHLLGAGASASIDFVLPEPSRALLALFDAGGRRIATLVDADLPAGPHAASWNGRASDGRPAAPGVYFLRLVARAASASLPLIVMR